MPRSRPNRPPAPEPDALGSLEAELHARQLAGPAAPADGGAEILLTFIGAHPGVTAKEALLEGRGHLSNRVADDLLRGLLYSGRLRSEPAGVAYTGRLKLFLASPGKD